VSNPTFFKTRVSSYSTETGTMWRRTRSHRHSAHYGKSLARIPQGIRCGLL